MLVLDLLAKALEFAFTNIGSLRRFGSFADSAYKYRAGHSRPSACRPFRDLTTYDIVTPPQNEGDDVDKRHTSGRPDGASDRSTRSPPSPHRTQHWATAWGSPAYVMTSMVIGSDDRSRASPRSFNDPRDGPHLVGVTAFADVGNTLNDLSHAASQVHPINSRQYSPTCARAQADRTERALRAPIAVRAAQLHDPASRGTIRPVHLSNRYGGSL